MLTQRLVHNAGGGATLVIEADAAGIGELIGLAEELKLRSTVTTEGDLHVLSGDTPTKIVPPAPE